MKPRVTYRNGHWHATHDCGWTYTSPNPNRAHTEAHHHHHGQPTLGPRPLPPDTIITSLDSGPTIYTPDRWTD